MAKQIGGIIIVGTIDDITFYQSEGKSYARRKSSLTGKKGEAGSAFYPHHAECASVGKRKPVGE